jgi:hypothetical protein
MLPLAIHPCLRDMQEQMHVDLNIPAQIGLSQNLNGVPSGPSLDAA